MNERKAVTVFGPDFPFAYDNWITHPDGLGTLADGQHGKTVAVIGAGMSGMVAAFELMKLGLKPLIFESGRMGGRLRSEPFTNSPQSIAELGGMRFPESATAFNHYVELLQLQRRPFPNPLTEAAGSTVIDLSGEPRFARTMQDLPPLYQEVADAWTQALNDEAHFSELQQAIVDRDVATIKQYWDVLVHEWDDRTFYDFVATSKAFQRLSFRHREVFGQVGFGTGGWDSDFRNTMLEILRVVLTECDDHQHYIVGGAEQLPRGLWTATPACQHWPQGTSLKSLNNGATRSGVKKIQRVDNKTLRITDQYDNTYDTPAVLATCQSWLLTTSIETDEQLFSQDHWMALDRTSYMQSSKTFVMVDRPFWKDLDPATGQPCMSMTLTDRLTRGTYLFDNGDDQPGVICLSYAWMSDALKMLPLPAEERARLALNALQKIYPTLDIRSHVIGNPITISWEADPNFLGAFKGALPGHYRYNRRMFTHFMQAEMQPEQQGIFIAGDDVSWTPGWAEGAVQTALNAVWGIVHHLGGHTHPQNPGPGDEFEALAPVAMSE
ncbi:flavin monoamine oxidase family protein [Granulosicoccus antarcticus]|uniref:Tryptophan 2-monooxygenase n=1 Tax=Granulosicoccus antarcticus IMCC3135 TaxID=1192854 RepID=A0A2Z2P5W7_9GAMM|nr:NAD(P)/FAD-dependent oxidoreductase [Granulosicoccus antarcticus]ASJ75234.1 Tryptophan 2-monooxygenase [Granulosicoccus antarcticus IMCC3135]